MGCYHPIPATQDRPGTPIKLWAPVGTANLQIPCGNCIGCKTAHALDWARRSQYEASSWDHNCFVTLTYDDEHIHEKHYLVPSDLTEFLKKLWRSSNRMEPTIQATLQTRRHLTRLRKGFQGPRQLKLLTWRPLRYLACGEYGDTTARPHYHILLFNCSFSDQKQVGKDLYESATLAKLWKKGAHKIGALTGASANYVAQYTLKKIGWHKDADGAPPHDEDGEVIPAPFLRASLKPAIGSTWTQKHYKDLQHGYLVVNGRKEKIPRALKRQIQKIDPQLAEQAQHNASQHPKRRDNLTAAEAIHLAKAKTTQQRRAI